LRTPAARTFERVEQCGQLGAASHELRTGYTPWHLRISAGNDPAGKEQVCAPAQCVATGLSRSVGGTNRPELHEEIRMRRILRNRPSSAIVIACLALSIALGGTSYAAIAISENSIKSAHIARGQVKRSDVARNAVTSAKIADSSLLAKDFKSGQLPAGPKGDPGPAGPQGAKGDPGPSADLAPQEAYHAVGSPGEPQFFDGGEGDCVWKNGFEAAAGTAPTGFARDVHGRVWLRGLATATAGPGGDAKCDPADPGEAEDGLVFVLPPAYRPAFLDVSGIAHAIVIAPDAGAVLNGNSIPPGGVHSQLAGNALLDGISIQAARGTAQAAQTPAKVSLQALGRLAG
jgi:hypothetical protein